MEGGTTYALETVRPSYDFDDDVEMAVLSLVVSNKQCPQKSSTSC